MLDTQWIKALEAEFGSALVSIRESAPNEPEFTVARERSHDFLKALKSLPGGAFDHLADLTAYDDKGSEPRFKVVYSLISMERKQRCLVLVGVAESVAESEGVASVTDLWEGAGWLEREAYDMYGIRFVGHPDLRRILMPEVFKGYPLRKDFDLFYRQSFPESIEDAPSFDPFGTTVVTEKE